MRVRLFDGFDHFIGDFVCSIFHNPMREQKNVKRRENEGKQEGKNSYLLNMGDKYMYKMYANKKKIYKRNLKEYVLSENAGWGFCLTHIYTCALESWGVPENLI